MMRRIGVLASDNMMPDSPQRRIDSFEGDEQMSKFVDAFAAVEMTAEVIRWREAAQQASEFDAFLPLFVWDYFEGNEAAFLAQMQQASQQTPIWNSPKLLAWNSNKSYLQELEAAGASVIRTLEFPRVTPEDVGEAFETLQADTIVIKPKVGGGAWRQVLLKRSDPFPPQDQLPPGDTMIQPFLPAVVEEGEYSLLFFDGQFSHALRKKPQSGDYRIQSMYGGIESTHAPSDEELKTAKAVLAALDEVPLYARVDLLRGTEGDLKLIELELIEPYLYLPHAAEEKRRNRGAVLLAEGLRRRLDG